MNKHEPKKIACQVCGKAYPKRELIQGKYLRPSLAALIKKECPGWNEEQYVCRSDINRFRMKYIETMLHDEQGEISKIEREVLDSINQQEFVSENVDKANEPQLSLGDRVADRIATFGGSWRFIFIFFGFLAAWMIFNSVQLLFKPFDQFPFILLNLILSCLAAIQAPIIMMSQNRQEDRDRLRAENDYKVNLKSEIEVRTLHEKLDFVMNEQWQQLMDIQEMQMELMEEIMDKLETRK